MSVTVMPISRFLGVAGICCALIACGKTKTDSLEKAEKSAEKQAAQDGKIECALAGGKDYARTCETERLTTATGTILVIRHPDGGFRRFKILTDGRGLAPAQGFDETKITVMGDGLIELSSGDDRYRLPAKIKPRPAVAAAPAVQPNAAQTQIPAKQ
jgi:hypothetical protein